MKPLLILLLCCIPVFAQETRTTPAVAGMTAEQEAQLKASVAKFLADTDQKINEAIKRDNPNGLPKRDWVADDPRHRFWREFYRYYVPPTPYRPRYVSFIHYYPLLLIHPHRCR